MLFSPFFIQEPIDGGLGKWSKYSKCSQSCGGGIQSRTRKCDNPVPLNGGADCAGEKTETRQCYAKPCPVNGVFGKWSKYSICSASCGGGVQYRERKCNSPPPMYGGKDCNGPTRETRSCAESQCPGNRKTFM